MSQHDFMPRDSIAQDTQSLPHVPDAGFWGIKDFAKLFGVTPRTIRFYEDKGLIAPSREAGSRVFTPRDYIRVERILRGKRLGFSLDDIKDVFEVADGHVTSRVELMHRKDNFRKVVKSLERRRHDIKQVTMEMDMMCQDIENFIQATADDEAGAVFKHAEAYAAAFAQTFSDDEYPLGYPANAHVSP